MNSYPYRHISLNGRQVAIDDIRSGAVATQTDFEFTTVSFLREWLEGTTTFVQKTSGSTGTPKEIIITRDQMIASANATEKALDLKVGYHALICLDTRFIAGKMMCVRSLNTGMHMRIIEPASNPLATIPKDAVIDFVALVPYQLDDILSSPDRDRLDQIGTVIIGGAPVKSETSEQLKSYKTRFFLTYGMTETMSHIALQQINQTGQEGSFECLPGVEIEVDLRGCLVASVPWLTEKVFTNDIVDVNSSRSFRWVGRYDNVINTGGFKANPEKIEFQIEKVFKSLNVNRRFFVAGLPDGKTGERVALFVEGPDITGFLDELQNRLKLVIQRFEIPRSIHFVDGFSYTSSNKLDRTTTLQRFHSK